MSAGRRQIAGPTLPRTNVGHLIGAVFGVVFVMANGGWLGPRAATALNVTAVIAVLVVVVAFLRGLVVRSSDPSRTTDRFSRRYWVIVAATTVVLLGGLALLRLWLPSGALGWIALVVGAHFLPLSREWPQGRRQLVAVSLVMVALGVVGLAVAVITGSAGVVSVIAGVGSGFVLLTSGVVPAVRTLAASRPHRTHLPTEG